MGRKLNHATPTVINTELVPLDESFYIEASGELEQWYYDNSKQFAPNRIITPLTLTPMLSVFDKDTSISYTPAFYTTRWFVNEYDAAQGEYVEREIVSAVDGSSPEYIISGDNLLVKKNVSYTRSVTIRCEATYIDPRDSGVTYTTRDSVILTCNHDATVVFPDVAITSPKTRSFNPLTDYKTVEGVEVQDSQFDFDATITNNPEVEEQANDYLAKYEVDGGGTEELVAQDDSITSAPTMQIRYPDGSVEQDATFVKRATAGGTKPTLSGEAVMDSMQGNTVKFSQLIQNGNFANGTTNWTNAAQQGASTWDVSNNVLTVTVTSASKQNSSIYQSRTIVAGHKYYVSYNFKNSENYPSRFNIGSTQVYDETKKIVTAGSDSSYVYFYYGSASGFAVGYTCSFANIHIHDLTEMFGEGNEPETVEAFESWLDANVGTYDYYPYNAGSLIPVNIKSIKSESFNIWDEQWEVGYINVNDGTDVANANKIRSKNYIPVSVNTYRFFAGKKDTFTILGYDINKAFVKVVKYANNTNGWTFTVGADIAYIRFTTQTNTYGNTYLNDICINISDPNRDGTYKPHILDNTPFDITQIKGKLLDASGNPTGNSVVVFPDGLKKAGNVFDEIKVENGQLYAVRRVSAQPVADTAWATNSDLHTFSTTSARTKANTFNIKFSGKMTHLRANYGYLANFSAYCENNNLNNMYTVSNTSQGRIYIYTTDYTTVEDFVAAFQNDVFYVEDYSVRTYLLDPIENPFLYKWFGISNGQEVDATTMPWYVSGQNTSKLKVDAMFGESINVVLRAQMPNGTLSPSKAYAGVEWRIPDIDTHVLSNNGGAVRSDTTSMTFDTVANVKGDVLTDARKQQHLRFNWKYRKNNNTTENDAGWGNSVTINASNLRNVKGASSTLASTLVYPYVYVLGAWQTSQGTITGYNKPTLEKDGVTYYRIIDD